MPTDIVARALAIKANKTLPAISSTDAGKLATVDSNGKWVAANLTVGQGEVAVDSTLLVSGAAADAKVTGDKVADLKSAMETKAEVDGYYEQMTVGNAEQLVATVGVEDKAPYNFRTAGGSADIGDRLVDKLVGGTIAWNQLVANGDFSEGTTGWNATNGTNPTVVNNVYTFTPAGQYNNMTQNLSNNNPGCLKYNYKYLLMAEIKTETANNNIQIGVGDNVYFTYTKSVSTGTTFSEFSYIVNIASQNVSNIREAIFVRTNDTSNFTPISVKNVRFFNLTQMFGSTIADYIYFLETANAGAGVAWFRKLFPKPYYAYNAGELMSVQAASHKTVGFNVWDEEWELGTYDVYGNKQASTTTIRSKNFIPVLPSTQYYFMIPSPTTNRMGICWYDQGKNLIYRSSANTANGQLQSNSNAHFITFYMDSAYGTTYNHDICINLSWDGERDGEYEPYTLHEYPLDSSLTLRGIPKLDANNELYYDGDEYESDGTVTRKYGVVDLGTLGDWMEYSGYPGLFYLNVTPSGAKIPASNTVLPSLIANGYIAGISRDIGTSGHTKGEIALANNRTYISNDTYAGNVSGFRTAISGVYLVYELATNTTESADPYQNPQIVDDFGTEEYVDAGMTATTPTRDVAIPVGHVSQYQANLRAKLEMAPNSPDGDGDYIVRQTNGQNEYVALTFPADELPAAPTTNGTYTLKCTVSGSGTTYAWVADT